MKHVFDQILSDNALTTFSALALFLCLSLAIVVRLIFKEYRRKEDLRHFFSGLQALLQSDLINSKVWFSGAEIQRLWHLVLALRAKLQNSESNTPSTTDVISLSARIVDAATENESIGESVIQLIMEKTRPEVVACAVVLFDQPQGEIHLVSSAGLPQTRLSQSLLMSFDGILKGDVNWGYQLPKRGGVLDFSSFGISAALTVPIKGQGRVIGGIWLGLRSGALAITPARKELIVAVAEQASASFNTARKVQAEKNKSESEKSFLVGLSHDLRAPGNAALYALQNVLSQDLGPINEEQCEQLQLAACVIREQLEMVGNVLDYAKHQRGLLKPQQEQIELRKIIAEVVASFRPEMERKSLNYLQGTIPDIQISFDPQHFKRILRNILSNATKYTERGEISIKARCDTSGEVEVTISDSGIGVPAECRSLLFKEFSRLPNGGSQHGSGLGLALSRSLAQLNGAELYYEPHSNGGSIFGLRTKAVSLTPKTRGMHAQSILVVEDDPLVLKTHLRFLQAIDADIYSAMSVSEAIDVIDAENPDLIVSDFYLSDGSIHQLLSHARTLPISPSFVVISGAFHTFKQAMSGPLDESITFLSKPVARQRLNDTVQAILRQRTTLLKLAANS